MPISKSDLSGIFPAVPTPVDSNGRFDRKALGRMIDYLFEGGMAGVAALGGTGEFLALLPEERIEVVEATVEAVRGRGPVIAGVLNPGFREAVRDGKALTKAGADALMLVTPYYVASTQSALRDYYRAFADSVGAPTLLYDIPYKTMVTVHPDTIAGMAEDRSIVGMKACNPDISHFMQVIAQVGDRIAVLSGEDHLLPVQLAIGASGSIHATANLFPRQWGRIYELAADGRVRESLRELESMRPLMNAVFSEGNPGPLKEALAMIGIPMGDALRPLMPPASGLRERLLPILKDLQQREQALARGQSATA
jgi:4-hydroxy-tetrahydrodipicolinate synthase